MPVKKRAKNREKGKTADAMRVSSLETIARPARYDADTWAALIDLGWVQLVEVTAGVDKGDRIRKAQGELF